MKGASYNFDADVSIKQTFVPGASRVTDPLFTIPADLFQRDLRSITVSNSLDRPDGAFELELEPRPIVGEDSWDKLIRPYSLVTIVLKRLGPGGGAEAVMLGLVDHATRSEDWASTGTERVIRIAGRALSAVLTDHRLWFHNYLQQPGILPADLRQFFATAPFETSVRDVVQQGLGFLAMFPRLFTVSPFYHPADLSDLAFQFFVVGLEQSVPGQGTVLAPAPGPLDAESITGIAGLGKKSLPFIKVQFADGVSLADRLQFSRDAARNQFFDRAATLAFAVLPTQLPRANCWDFMRTFCEAPFAELYTDTVGEGLGDATVFITMRKPPWAGHVGTNAQGQAIVDFSNGHRPALHESQFDSAFGEWNRGTETVPVSGADVLSIPSMTRGTGQVYTAYEVTPRESSAGGDNSTQQGWQNLISPLFDEDVESPSSILRYGVRPLTARTTYIRATKDAVGNPVAQEIYTRQCEVYEALLWSWLSRLPLMWRGQYVLKGHPALRVGKRLLDTDLNREFYIRSVVHRMQFTGEQPGYTTTLSVDRGWDIGSPEWVITPAGATKLAS